jgi:hypothetical protein
MATMNSANVPDGTADGDGGMEPLLERMTEIDEHLGTTGDARRWFHLTYTRTTRAVAKALHDGRFTDPDWVERWDVVFADLYLQALGAWDRSGSAPGPWQVAFQQAAAGGLPPLRLVLLGMNAHINFDLAQALVAVITPEEFDDPAVLARREADHRTIDGVLASRVAAEDKELVRIEPPGSRTVLDRLLTPFNQAGTKRFLSESRRKVWANAHLLDAARRESPDAYRRRLDELGRLSGARVADLAAPGQVILRLARKGFGVELSS